MNKKAFVEVDIFAIVVILIFFFIFTLSLQFIKTSSFEVNSVKQKLNHDLFLINILKTKIGDYSLKEIILQDYSKNEFTETKSSLNDIFSKAFGEKLCWSLIIQEKYVSEDDDCKEMNELDIGELDALVYLPFEIEDEIKILEIRLKS